jgi:hypothetical protein
MTSRITEEELTLLNREFRLLGETGTFPAAQRPN